MKVMSRKDQLERSLSQITGGRVTIYDIHDAHKSKLGSVIHAWISSPSKATIDLRNLQSVINDIVGDKNMKDNLIDATSGTRKPKNQNLSSYDNNNSGLSHQNHIDQHHESIHTASVIRTEYQTLLWILAFFILLTIVFLIILICIWWCCCCRQSPQHMKQWMENGGPSPHPMPQQYVQAPPAHTSVTEVTRTKSPSGTAIEKKRLVDKKGKKLTKDGYQGSSLESDEVYFRPSGFEGRYGVEIPTFGGRHTGTRFPGQASRVRKITRPKNPRARIHPAMTGTSRTTMDTADMVYLHGGGERGVRFVRSDGEEDEDSRAYALGVHNSSFDEEYDGGQRRDSRREKKTEIMYIRSPPEQVREDDYGDQEYRSASEAVQINDPDSGLGDYFSERRRSSVKQVSFQMQPIQRHSPDSIERKEDERAEKMRRSPSEHTIFSQDKVYGCEDSDCHRLPDDDESQGRRTRLMNGQRPSSGSRASTASTTKYITKVTLPGTVEDHDEPTTVRQIIDVERISSDSDSGIGTRRQVNPKTELNLKNKSLMEKKSIFTLAYDGIKTDRIHTAGSGHDSY